MKEQGEAALRIVLEHSADKLTIATSRLINMKTDIMSNDGVGSGADTDEVCAKLNEIIEDMIGPVRDWLLQLSTLDEGGE